MAPSALPAWCKVCALIVYVTQIAFASVNKAELREEDLLPVRTSRAAADDDFEGSGDVDRIPISSLNNNVMERLSFEDKEKSDGGESREIVEDIGGEGSGFDEVTSITEPGTVAKVDTEDDITSTEGERYTTLEEVEVGGDTTAASVNKTTTTLPVTGTVLDLQTRTDVEEITTETVPAEPNTTTELSETTTIAPGAPDSEAVPVDGEKGTGGTPITAVVIEPTTESEREPVTELVESKHVEPVLVVPGSTVVDEPATEPQQTTTATAVDAKTNAPEIGAPTNPLPVATVTSSESATPPDNENLTVGTDTLLMKANPRLLDSSDTILLGSKDSSRLGTYIVVSLILLSFLSLMGYILMKRRVRKRRKQGNLDQEALDTEKALLSLSEYKDHPDGVDEGKIKNNEITPIVIKSNSQINKFEKNTNFSSPKNLNTKANEKNVEKDNVLKRASDNLTQVIIEDPSKDAEEEKAPTNAEKLIVRTHLDQDSIPKKPVIVNRTSVGSVVVSQD